MPENTIKPSEVSEVLLRQLQGIDNSLKFDEVGTVLGQRWCSTYLRLAQCRSQRAFAV